MRILLVEDDRLLGDGVQTALAYAGHTVDWLTHGDEGLRALESEDFDLVLLDLTLPGLDGLEVLARIRQLDIQVPLIILTARDTTADRIEGLDLGADDYLVKPFDVDELMARIRAVRRRHVGRSSPLIVHGELTLDPASRLVTFRGLTVELQRRELDLLQELLENAGKVMSREILSTHMYGWQDNVESNALEVHIHHLRKKLYPTLIETVRGIGYTINRTAD